MFNKANLVRPGRLPQEPTAALPGSLEKILIMTERASRREQLFHPLDGPLAPPAAQIDSNPALVPGLVEATEFAGAFSPAQEEPIFNQLPEPVGKAV
jgi:hypothetical protein